MAPDTAALIAQILNAAWMVRHYARGGRLSIQRKERKQAIRQLGIVVRHAFTVSDDYEPLLVALFDGLSPKDAPPF